MKQLPDISHLEPVVLAALEKRGGGTDWVPARAVMESVRGVACHLVVLEICEALQRDGKIWVREVITKIPNQAKSSREHELKIRGQNNG